MDENFKEKYACLNSITQLGVYTEGAYSYVEVQDGKNISSLAHNRNYVITSCTVNYSFIVKNCFCLQEIYKNVFSFLYLKVGFTIHVLKKDIHIKASSHKVSYHEQEISNLEKSWYAVLIQGQSEAKLP